MLISLAMIAAQAGGMISNSAPPEVAVITVQPAPPIVTSSRIARPPVAAGEIAPIRVRVAAGNRVLFSDVLRVARNRSASYSQNRNEAGDFVCDRPGYYGSGESHSLSVSLTWRDETSNGPAVQINVNWQRPGENADPCFGDGSRSVALSQSVPLRPGESQTIRGDGGLTVTISRP